MNTHSVASVIAGFYHKSFAANKFRGAVESGGEEIWGRLDNHHREMHSYVLSRRCCHEGPLYLAMPLQIPGRRQLDTPLRSASCSRARIWAWGPLNIASASALLVMVPGTQLSADSPPFRVARDDSDESLLRTVEWV